MGKHMLKYHVGVPLAVFAVLVAAGVPLAGAVPIGIAAGCVSMVLMMFTGGMRHAHRRSAHGTASGERRTTAQQR